MQRVNLNKLLESTHAEVSERDFLRSLCWFTDHVDALEKQIKEVPESFKPRLLYTLYALNWKMHSKRLQKHINRLEKQIDRNRPISWRSAWVKNEPARLAGVQTGFQFNEFGKALELYRGSA